MQKNVKKILITSVAILIIAIIFLHYRGQKSEVVPTVTVVKGDITEYSEAIGRIKPLHSSIVKSQIDGIVAEIYHDDGEYVTKGTPLIKVDPSPSPELYASVHQQLAEASAKETAAKRDLARFEVARIKGLIKSNYNEYIIAKQASDSAKSERIFAEQKLALYDKGMTTISGKPIANIVVSPIDGYLLLRNVDVGDPVISLSSAQAATSLFSVANMHDFMFQGVIDEMDASKIKLGMPSSITVGSLPDTAISGKLSKIALQSESENSTISDVKPLFTTETSPFNVGFKVEITGFDLPKNLTLRSGYSANAKITIKTAKNVLLLPMRVIQFQDEKPYVLLAATDKSQSFAKQPVTLGISDGVNVEIKNGIALGEKIVDKQEKPVSDNGED